MAAVFVIFILWLGFAGSHVVLSSAPVRGALVERCGENRFRLLYSLLALAFFIPLVWVYFTHKHAGPVLWMLPHAVWVRWIVGIGMAIALTLYVAGLVHPSPTGIMPGKPEPTGAYRIARHPQFAAFALFGLVHLLPNGAAADIIFFGGFVVFALIGGWQQDQRKLASGDPGYRDFYAATPFVPFTGSGTLQGIKELNPAVLVAGIAITVVIRYFHASWFGG